MSLKDICEGLPGWAHYIVWVCLFLGGFWLGKTSKLKAGSTVELVFNLLKTSKNKGENMEGKIGQVGEYQADVSKDGHLKLSVSVDVDLVAELEKLAEKTATPIDDQAMAWVKKMLGR